MPVPPKASVKPESTIQGLDESEEDHVAWIYWGSEWNGMKVLNAGGLGELVLGK